jgi:hypothetical protein
MIYTQHNHDIHAAQSIHPASCHILFDTTAAHGWRCAMAIPKLQPRPWIEAKTCAAATARPPAAAASRASQPRSELHLRAATCIQLADISDWQTRTNFCQDVSPAPPALHCHAYRPVARFHSGADVKRTPRAACSRIYRGYLSDLIAKHMGPAPCIHPQASFITHPFFSQSTRSRSCAMLFYSQGADVRSLQRK